MEGGVTVRIKREVALGVFLMAVSLLAIVVVIPIGVDRPANVPTAALAPQFWPRIVVYVLGLCGVVMAVGALLRRKPAIDSDPSDTVSNDWPQPKIAIRVGAAIAGLFLFYVSINILGIVVSSGIAIVAFSAGLARPRWRVILPIAVLIPTALYAFFVHVANVPMPLGIFEALR